MQAVLEKVTVFITHDRPEGTFLLLFQHPYAGIQIPAGTFEPGETPEQAALQEGFEESGLSGLMVRSYLGSQQKDLGETQRITLAQTPIYSRPNPGSSQWAYIRRGIQVAVERTEPGFTQVTYREFDRLDDPQYVTVQITGWAPDDLLASVVRRHFFHLEYQGALQPKWEVTTDHHVYAPFWARVTNLPRVTAPQNEWLALFLENLTGT